VHPWGNPLALLRFPGPSLIAKLRYGLHAFVSVKRKNWRGLDRLEATNWIRKWVGDQAYEVFWQKLFDYKFYDYADQLSAAWIWSRIRRIGRSRYDIFREKLGYLEGGSETLLQSLEEYLRAHGTDLRLRTPVLEVAIESSQVRGVTTGSGFEPFAKVISTVPLPYVARLMPNLPENLVNAYRSIRNIAVVCVIAKLRKPVTENFWLNINDPDIDAPGLVEYTNLRPLDSHLVYVPFYMPGDHPQFKEPNQRFLDKVRAYLCKINPQLKDEDFLALHASRYRYAQPVCEPGFLERLPPPELPIAGLWVADTSYYYPEDRGISESVGFGRELAKSATL
jgi:protoporphyrinogen oxidase